MSVIRRRNEALAINAHKWEMWNVSAVTVYDKNSRSSTEYLTIGNYISLATSYSFNRSTGKFTLNNPTTYQISSSTFSLLSGKYKKSGSGLYYIQAAYYGDTSFYTTGTYYYATGDTYKVKGDTFGGYIYSADSDTYPDNNYVGDVWYVKVF